MNAITPFIFEDLLVRTMIRLGNPWFHAADVCRCLDIKNVTDALTRLDDDEVTLVSNEGQDGPANNFVSEPGLYSLILGSRKPSARRFKRWVTHDVLPAIRKNGVYRMATGQAMGEQPSQVQNPFELTAEALPVYLAKMQTIREARHLFGHERARYLWVQLKLPDVSVNPHDGKGAAYDLLQYILDGKYMACTLWSYLEAALEGDKASNDYLKHAGLFAEPARDGFIVANQHPHLETVLQGTEWGNGKWQWVLRRLPGVVPVAARHWMKGVNARGLFLPCALLDFAEHDIGRDFERPST
jgi:prophage antirepressor-like protein